MRLVLEANALVAGLLWPRSTAAEVLRLLVTGEAVLCYDARILAEYREAMAERPFGLDQKLAAELLAFFESEGLPFEEASFGDSPIAGIPETVFYEVAEAARAHCLVTLHPDRYPSPQKRKAGALAVTPEVFLESVWRKKPPHQTSDSGVHRPKRRRK